MRLSLNKLFLTFALFVTSVTGARAAADVSATRPAALQDGSELRIYLMTFSPGAIIYERFGHNVIVIHDPSPSAEHLAERATFDERYANRFGLAPPGAQPFLPTDRAHHYGAFGFDQPGFVPRFIMGRMEYWTESTWADFTALAYAGEDREVRVQELNLTAAQKRDLKTFLEWNEQPENRTYRYDYYRDNCSTRVRDAIDRVTAGGLKRQMTAIATGTTYRSHTRRMTSGLDPVDVFWFTGFTYVLGHPVDVPLSAWEEAFLPGKLAEHVRNATVIGEDGNARPLVSREFLLSKAKQPPMPATEPTRILGYLVGGLVVGGMFAGLARLARRPAPSPPSPGTPGEGRGEGSAVQAKRNKKKDPHPSPLPAYRERESETEHRTTCKFISTLARITFTLLILFWTILWSLGGSIAFWGWAVTDHAASYRNENLLQFNPLIIPLIILGPMLAFGYRRGATFAVWIGWTITGLSVAGLALKILPAFWQHNAEIIALAIPANIGLAAALMILTRWGQPLNDTPTTTTK